MEDVPFNCIYRGVIGALIQLHYFEHKRDHGVIVNEIVENIVLLIKKRRVEFEFEAFTIIFFNAFMQFVCIYNKTVVFLKRNNLAVAADF